MRATAAGLVLLAALAAGPAFGAEPPDYAAIVDSLLFWHDAGRPDRVDSLAGPAVAAARAADDSLHLLPLLLVRGADRAAVGRVRPAEADLREALALAEAHCDTSSTLRALRWLGIAVGRQGRADEAAAVFSDLAGRSAVAADSLHLGWAWVGLAYDDYLAGRSAAAAERYGQAAVALERAGESRGAVWAWNGRGLALRQAGRFAEARAAFARVLALAEADGDALNQAMALNYLGRLEMLLGDPSRAIGMLGRAAAIHRQRNQHREGLVPCIDIAAARVEQGRFAEAAALLDSVLVVCRTEGLRDLEMLAGTYLAEVRLAQDRPAAAATVCRRLLAGGEAPSRMAATETRLRLARALAAKDSCAAAADLLQRVQDTGPGAATLAFAVAAQLGEQRLTIGETAAAVAVLAPAAARAEQANVESVAVVLLTRLGCAQRASGHLDAAQATFDRAVAIWERQRLRPDDPAWRELRSAGGDLFAEAAASLVAQPHRGDGLAAAFALVQRYKARTLQERMMGPAAPRSAVPTAPGLAELQAHVLREGEVLLDVVEGEQVAVLFCVTGDSALVALLPGRRSLAPRLQLLADAVTSPGLDDVAPVQALAAAAMAEWPPVVMAALRQARSVIWSPDGSWHRLPLAVVVGDRPLARVPSTAVLARLRTRSPHGRTEGPLLAVCGPDPAGHGPLPGAAAEIRRLAARYRSVHCRGIEGDDAFDADLWRQAAIVHLATHTQLDPWQPWNTAVTLGRGEGQTLKAAEIARLDLQARLVVLAGCTTAGDRTIGGEGLIGLAGGFLATRVPVVVATLWPVDDHAAARFMDPFYAALATGQPVAEALATARAACRADPRTAAPRYWAGFVAVGDGATTAPVHPRRARWPLIALLLVAAGAAGLQARR